MTDSKPNLQSIQIHYIKTNDFRVLIADGVVGSITPHGRIFFAPYTERAAIPRAVTHTISEAGALGDATETDTRGGLVRELNVGIMLDHDDAVRLRDWLSARIVEHEAVTKISIEQRSTGVKKSNVRNRRKSS